MPTLISLSKAEVFADYNDKIYDRDLCHERVRGCLCDIWKPSFLPLPIFNWSTFSRRVTAHWWRQWAKNQLLTNQNSRNRWIVRRTMCYEAIHLSYPKSLFLHVVKHNSLFLVSLSVFFFTNIHHLQDSRDKGRLSFYIPCTTFTLFPGS